MLAPPIPSNENERLAAVRALGILDTPSEERFDRVTKLAMLVFDVPIAYVAIIDSNRQWFKSRRGFDAAETPRGISLCGHAVLGCDALVVPDTHLDARFRDNPMVTGEPFARFYAGQPLRGPGGLNVGTLCVVDRKPRTFSKKDAETLALLGRLVENELGLVDTIQIQNDLIGTKQALSRELEDAAAYVRSTLPSPARGAVTADWRFLPSSSLGGDALGYHWIDHDRFALYVLDVAGHGVGSALLSVSVMNVLRSRSMYVADYADPAGVMKSLNAVFPMEEHGGKCFSIWYGVYDRRDRTLRYVSAGHPPALLMPSGSSRATELNQGGQAIGLFLDTGYFSETAPVPPGTKLFVFSDGVFETLSPGGVTGGYPEWRELVERNRDAGLDSLLAKAKEQGEFRDDVSILEANFS